MNTKHGIAKNSLRKWSAKLAVLAVGASVVGQVAPAQAKLLGLSEEEEIRAGQQVAAQAQKEYGRALPPNDPMSRRVNAIGRKFANIAERRNVPYTYTVLQNDKVLNAFAAPGGPIFVTTKLLRTTQNDAELAYVLGHETAHIERRHIAKSIEKQQKVGIGAAILGAVLGNRGGGIAGTLIKGTYAVWQSGYSRDQETDSDVVGVRMMARLGYDPRAAMTMLQKMDAEGGGGRGGGLDKYLSTHPAPAARIKSVSALIQKDNLLDVARRSGGPRLSDGGNYGNTSYTGGGSANNDQYPDDYATGATGGNGGYANGNGSNDYPDYNTGGNTGGNTGNNSGDRVADLGGPLRIVERGGDSVILASAAGVARWAGATVRNNGTLTTLTRGNRKLELRRNSTVAYLNGRRQDLSVAPSIVNGLLYAPLGDLVEGVGGQARFDEQQNAIRLQLDGRESFISLRR